MAKKFSIPERVWLREGLRSPLRSLLVVMYHRRDRMGRASFRSLAEIAKLSGMGEEKARRGIKELIRRKIIKREKPTVFVLPKGGRQIFLPSPLATAVMSYKERAYLSLIWSLKENHGDGKAAILNLADLQRLTGEAKETVCKTLKDLTEKELVSKEPYGNMLRIQPLFPILLRG